MGPVHVLYMIIALHSDIMIKESNCLKHLTSCDKAMF